MLKDFRFITPIIVTLFLLAGDIFAFSPPKEPLPCLDKKFTIIAHIVRDTAGLENITIASINTAIGTVNQYFAPICVSFEICEVRYIDNFQYDNLHDQNEWPQMQIDFNQENRINMYFVEATSIAASFATLAGIANMTSGGLVIIKSSTGIVYTHEMGHYFGLPHTFEGAGTPGAELVDGSNGTTAGDGVLDTPADPYTGIEYLEGCKFVGPQQDANGDYYTPHVGNIMSYYDDACKCEFTHGQYMKMANTYLNSNPKMW
jgi:hypothetical protein